MFVFKSMFHVIFFTILTTGLFVLLILRRKAIAAVGLCMRKIATARKYTLHLIALFAILFFNKMELWYEKQMASSIDFTPVIYRLEGDLVAYVQKLLNHEILTFVLTYFYIIVFPALILASLIIYTYHNERFYYATCYALMINYLAAIPFYLYFPVNEAWFFNPNVEFLIPRVFPTFESDYRPLSGLNNSFPSLHTSISFTLALLAAKSGHKAWGRTVLLCAAVIIFSIFYLGIHWFSDMTAGLMLGFLAVHVGLRMSESKFDLSKKVALTGQER